VKPLIIISTGAGETIDNAMRTANVAVQQEDEVSVFIRGKGILKKEVSGCQNLRKDQVLAPEAAVREAVVVLAQAPADSVSVRPAATRRPISREFPASKSNVPNAGR
jgi:hypothetical protein